MRVVSLVPAATEIIAALGAGNFLVGISHACDYPPEVRGLPRVTYSSVDPALPAGGGGAAAGDVLERRPGAPRRRDRPSHGRGEAHGRIAGRSGCQADGVPPARRDHRPGGV